MMPGRKGPGLALLAGLICGFSAAVDAAPVDDAAALYRQKRFSEAKAILEPVAAAEPSNARADYLLGMSDLRLGGPAALDQARSLLARALRLAPGNENYLAEYSGVCLLLADRDNSFSLAMEGRDGMTRAFAANPADLEAAEGLMRFYAKAPWPLEDPDKALALAAQIARADPRRGLSAYRSLQATFERKGRAEKAISASKAAQSLAQAHPE
jgi:tetratricopeptide (TPR) repeat protein